MHLLFLLLFWYTIMLQIKIINLGSDYIDYCTNMIYSTLAAKVSLQ